MAVWLLAFGIECSRLIWVFPKIGVGPPKHCETLRVADMWHMCIITLCQQRKDHPLTFSVSIVHNVAQRHGTIEDGSMYRQQLCTHTHIHVYIYNIHAFNDGSSNTKGLYKMCSASTVAAQNQFLCAKDTGLQWLKFSHPCFFFGGCSISICCCWSVILQVTTSHNPLRVTL